MSKMPVALLYITHTGQKKLRNQLPSVAHILQEYGNVTCTCYFHFVSGKEHLTKNGKKSIKTKQKEAKLSISYQPYTKQYITLQYIWDTSLVLYRARGSSGVSIRKELHQGYLHLFSSNVIKLIRKVIINGVKWNEQKSGENSLKAQWSKVRWSEVKCSDVRWNWAVGNLNGVKPNWSIVGWSLN
jgi:hypothetical protein